VQDEAKGSIWRLIRKNGCEIKNEKRRELKKELGQRQKKNPRFSPTHPHVTKTAQRGEHAIQKMHRRRHEARHFVSSPLRNEPLKRKNENRAPARENRLNSRPRDVTKRLAGKENKARGIARTGGGRERARQTERNSIIWLVRAKRK